MQLWDAISASQFGQVLSMASGPEPGELASGPGGVRSPAPAISVVVTILRLIVLTVVFILNFVALRSDAAVTEPFVQP